MKKNILNNKGFTLVELLATIAILALVMGIATFSITVILNKSKEKNYQLLITSIKDAAETYYQECKYSNNTGINCNKNTDGSLKTTLGELLTYGYLKGNDTEGKNVITNPQKNNIDISSCSIIIKYNNGSISVENDSSIVNDTCPTF